MVFLILIGPINHYQTHSKRPNPQPANSIDEGQTKGKLQHLLIVQNYK